MAKPPVRESGWEDALLVRFRQLLVETAERHSLRLECSVGDPVALSCIFPRQPGLDFELWFALGGDELTLGTTGDDWYADIFPLDAPDIWQRTADAIDGLITGESRVLFYWALGGKKPYWSVLQLRENGRWTSVSTGLGCALPPIIRPVVVRNGHPRTTGSLRPAWGSILLLLLVAAALLYLF